MLAAAITCVDTTRGRCFGGPKRTSEAATVATKYLTQDDVASAAIAIAHAAEHSLDIASPWIEPLPVQKLVGPLLPRIRNGEVSVRLVYRVSEESDLRITDLTALEMLAAEGVQVRYSRRLHAKLVIADGTHAVVGSSNLTRRGGYGYGSQPNWRNQEGGVLIEAEPAASQTSRTSAMCASPLKLLEARSSPNYQRSIPASASAQER
jgi:phosphatidylserine/phosphatidylglycerophosphate/cardiolipin synthase-like enzyme